MGSGCGDSIVEKFLRPPGNSPSRWHLTRCLLLCSQITIHDFTGNVNSFFIDILGSISSDASAGYFFSLFPVSLRFPVRSTVQWQYY